MDEFGLRSHFGQIGCEREFAFFLWLAQQSLHGGPCRFDLGFKFGFSGG